MGKVVGINGESPSALGEPKEHLVKMLKDMVAMAESGKLQSLIATGFTDDGLRVSIWSDTHGDVYQMLGAIAWLQAEYVHRHTETLG